MTQFKYVLAFFLSISICGSLTAQTEVCEAELQRSLNAARADNDLSRTKNDPAVEASYGVRNREHFSRQSCNREQIPNLKRDIAQMETTIRSNEGLTHRDNRSAAHTARATEHVRFWRCLQEAFIQRCEAQSNASALSQTQQQFSLHKIATQHKQWPAQLLKKPSSRKSKQTASAKASVKRTTPVLLRINA